MKRPEVREKVSLALRGRIAWNWSGNPIDETQKARSSSEAKQWRMNIFSRDNFQCLMPGCDGSERYLEAHHIKTFASYPESRLDMKNGITLCRKCHDTTKRREKLFEYLFLEVLSVMYGY
jgi:5-methylcytosine-specific restriction endonuclease McrA